MVRSYAKINLSIDVGERQPDGFHPVDMIMQQIQFHDDVTVVYQPSSRRERGDITVSLQSNRVYLPSDERNLAVKAAILMIREYGKDQPGGRIDLEGGADNQHQVGLRYDAGGFLDVGDGFPEEYDVRTQLDAGGGAVPEPDRRVSDVDDFPFVPGPLVDPVFRAYLGQFTVQVEDVRAPGSFVEVVHVLGDDRHVVVPFQGGDQAVALVGFGVAEPQAQVVVKVQDQFPVAVPPRMGRDLLDGILVPKASVAAECLEAAVHADAGACQHGDSFPCAHTDFSSK